MKKSLIQNWWLSGVTVVSNWILATGFWNDSNTWVDTENWID